MTSVAAKYEWMPQTRYLGPARVLEVDDTGRRVRLRLTGYPQEGDTWARIAISGHHALKRDDLALVVGEELTDLYLIGILNGETALNGSERKIALSGGTQAQAAGPPEQQTLKVFSAKRELLFEYDEKNSTARVNMEAGNIEFVTRNGNIIFASGREILFHGKSIGLTSMRGICLGVMDTLGKLRSAITLQPGSTKLTGPEVGIDAQRGKFKIGESKYEGEKFSGKIEDAKLVMNRFETVAQTVIEKVKNVYKTVEQLSQLKTGRMRTLVESTLHLKSKTAFIKSEEDFKVRAQKIHLG